MKSLLVVYLRLFTCHISVFIKIKYFYFLVLVFTFLRLFLYTYHGGSACRWSEQPSSRLDLMMAEKPKARLSDLSIGMQRSLRILSFPQFAWHSKILIWMLMLPSLFHATYQGFTFSRKDADISFGKDVCMKKVILWDYKMLYTAFYIFYCAILAACWRPELLLSLNGHAMGTIFHAMGTIY